MAPERMKEKMTTKQKVTIGAFVVVVLVIIWQVKGLFGGNESVPPPTPTISAKAPGQMSAAAPGKVPGSMQPGGIQQPAGPPGTAMPGAFPGMPPNGGPAMDQSPMANQQLRQAPVTMDAQLVELQKQTEQKYIDQINQLQTLKIQKEIAETNQAIAAARLATVTAEKNVSDLLTKPTQQPVQPMVPTGAYSNILTSPIPSGTSVSNEAPPTPPTTTPPPPLEASYTVISVSMQLGRWSAVLGSQGKLYNVFVGDVLPADGSTVTSINKNGVTLIKQGKRRKISIITSI